MTMMLIEIELRDGGCVQLEGDTLKYWAGEGLPNYEGSIAGFAFAYPEVFSRLLAMGAIRQ